MNACSRGRRPLLAASLLLACANPPTGQLASHTAHALLHDASGRSVGTVELHESNGSLDVRAELHDLAEAAVTLALGTRGECEVRFQPAPFASAGGPSSLGTRPLRAFELSRGGGTFTARAEGLAISDGPAPLLDWDGSAILLRRPGDGAAPPVACGIVRR